MDVLIMAGGSGTRLWPVSRRGRPKQFCDLFKFEPLLVHALRRAETLRDDGDKILIIAGQDHLSWVVEQARAEATVIGEPVGRNTAPCVGLAACWFAAKNPDAVMAVLPADHLIEDTGSFEEDLRLAAEAAQAAGALVTFGVQPSGPHTGFGYIEAGAVVPGSEDRGRAVSAFTEKPDQERAEAYLAAGDYFWNAGIFVWRAADVLALIDEYMPTLGRALQEVGPHLGSDREAEAVRRFYLDLPSEAATSIDYGVLEPAAAAGRVVMIPAAFDWDDVGGWPALARHWPRDQADNAAGTRPGPVFVDAGGNLVHAENKLVALLGVRDMVVIATDDVVLVCPKQRAEEVRHLVERLQTDPDLKRYL